MKRWLILLLLAMAFTLNAGVKYNTQFGHFVVDHDCTLYITLANEDDATSRSSTLSYIAFSSAGSHSATVPKESGVPIELGFFAAGTSLTFWFTSVDPLAMPTSYNAMVVTNKIQVRTSPTTEKTFYTMENRTLHTRVAFLLMDEQDLATEKKNDINADAANVD